MENETQIRKLYAIARATRTTDEYISHIEYVLQGNSFSARALADVIYKAAMIKYEASIRKHASAVDDNRTSLADQMRRVRAFAIKYGLLRDYVSYIEGLVLHPEKFDIQRVLNLLTESDICIYDMRIRSKIDASTGITIIGGYRDAV